MSLKSVIITFFVLCTSNLVVSQENEALVGYWTFNEGQGDTTADMSGYENTGFLVRENGDVAWDSDTPSGEGYALFFDGMGAVVEIEDSDILQILGEITLAAWIKAEPKPDGHSDPWYNIVAKGYHWVEGEENSELTLRIREPQPAGNIESGTSWLEILSWEWADGGNFHHAANDTMLAGDWETWIHVAGTYDGTTWKLYKNGILISSAEDTVGAVDVWEPWAIGATGSFAGIIERCFAGLIDNVRIYDHSISEDEIQSIIEMEQAELSAVQQAAHRIPQQFVLRQNCPNPFNPVTTISYTLKRALVIRIDVFDVRGKLVRSLYNGQKTSGEHSIYWDATDNHGNLLPSGIYYYRLSSEDVTQTKKLIYLK